MRKLFTLLCLFLLGIGTASAQEIHKISFNGSIEITVGTTTTTVDKTKGGFDIFTWNKDKHNFNSKFTGATYDGVDYISGLKMESATNVSFTSTAKANVTIVQSTWSEKTINFDGAELAISTATPGTGNCRIYTIDDVAAGAHSLTRGDGESGIFCMIVEYQEAAKEKLASPTITYDPASGEVTIGTVDNAEAYYYTVDGQTPSVGAGNTYLYEEPFTVGDGKTVKAVAVDEDDVYAMSDPTEVLVLLDLDDIDEPTINEMNGTFYAVSDVPYALVEYSLDGRNWKTMTHAITLDEDGTVYARASRGSVMSDVATKNVTVIPKPEGTDAVLLVFEEGSVSGKVWTNDADYKLTINTTEDKTWTAGGVEIAVDGDVYKPFKLSNQAQNILTLPEGVTVKRMTLYSYINASAVSTANAWQEVNGETYDVNFLPMGSLQDGDNPDVRVYDMDTSGEITFRNVGNQLCFVIKLDVTGAVTRDPMPPTLYDFTQPLSDNDVENLNADDKWTVNEDGKTWELSGLLYERNVFGPLVANGQNIEMTDGLLFTRDNSEGLAKGIKFNNKKNLGLVNSVIIVSIPETAANDIIRIRFASTDAEGGETSFTMTNANVESIATVDKQDFELKVNRDAATTLRTSGNVAIYQIAINKELPSEEEGAATAISELTTMTGDAAAYNLAGQRVGESYKGVIVKNGKKIITK